MAFAMPQPSDANSIKNLLFPIRMSGIYGHQALMMHSSNMAFIQVEAYYLGAFSGMDCVDDSFSC